LIAVDRGGGRSAFDQHSAWPSDIYRPVVADESRVLVERDVTGLSS